MSIELVMPSNHLILCYPLLLLPSIFPSISVFSKGVGPGALEGGPRKHEPLAAPTQEAGESRQPWGRSPEGEVSAGVESRVRGVAGGLLLAGSRRLLLCVDASQEACLHPSVVCGPV